LITLPSRLLIAAACLLIAATLLPAADQNQLDASPSVFSVMAALNAAGMDHGAATSHPLRTAIRQELAKKQIPVLDELKRFVRTHRKEDPAADLAQYISFALSVTGPPDFANRMKNNEIPPDVADLAGFSELMVRFHQEAGVDDLWKRSQGAIEKELERYHEPVSKAVFEVHGYLRNPTSGLAGHHFQVFLDLLGPANQVHTRSFRNESFIVLTPAVEPQYQDVRHAYLHFLLDPLATRHAALIEKKTQLAGLAQPAPVLEASFKQDFVLLTNESLVKAVEARLARPADRAGLIEEAMKEGYILTAYFAEALPGYEKGEQAMRFYYPTLVNGIDVKRETERLAGFEFARERRARPAPPPLQREPEKSPGEKLIEDAEGLYANRELEPARTAFLKALRNEDTSIHARAYYGLARIAALERQPALAEELFRKTLEVSPDATTRAWTEVYLGRLAMAAQEPERNKAAEHFRRALATEGGSDAAKNAATDALAKLGIEK
jgi:tetratricopeptide (TPR) repeat protein